MTKMNINEAKTKLRRYLNEYTSFVDDVSEVDNDQNAMGGAPDAGMGGDPNAMGGAPAGGMGGDPGMMGSDPNAGMGGDPGMMGGDPNAMGGDPNAMGGDPNAMGSNPNTGGAATPPEGFSPQGIDQNSGMEGMGADTNAEMPQGEEGPGPEDDVVEIDDLTDAQEETEKKVDALTSKFEKVITSLDGIVKKISDIDTHTNEYLGSLKGEMEKRNPTPMQRLTMRSTKSSPYSMTPNEYMNNYAPENYSDDSDNNGADDPQYKITKGDIDDFVDYNSIAKDIANKKIGLKDIFGY